MSLTEVYKKIIEERWSEMNDKNKIEENDIPEEFLDSLSKLAFNKLFSPNEDDTIVFGIPKDQLEKKYQRLSLESGIMSCSSKIGERFVSFQFLHKTLQEYLSALYLAKSSRSDLIKHCQHVQEVYSHSRREGVLSMRQMFLFLCGMNITAVEVFSKTLNEVFTYGFSENKAVALQDMILQGYDEAERSGHAGAKLCLQHVTLGDYGQILWDGRKKNRFKQHKQILKHCLDKNKPTLVSLFMRGESDISDVLQDKNDSSVLDLETCKNLKYVVLEECPYTDINLLSWNGLLKCKIHLNGGPANKLVTSILSSDVTCLKILSIKWTGWEPKAQEIFSKLKHIEHLDVIWRYPLPNDSKFDLDLRHLEQLNTLSLQGLAFSDVVILHMLNLHKLKVSFSTQTRAPRLMAALLAQSDDSLSPNLDGTPSTLTDVELGNMILSAGAYRRLVRFVIQSGHYVNCKLSLCKLELEEDMRQLQVGIENQSALQLVAPQPVSSDYTTYISSSCMVISVGEFRRLVSIVTQSGHSVNCEFSYCTIKLEEDVRQLQVGIENQSALQMVALQPVTADYTTYISLSGMVISVGEFRRLVSIVTQSGHSVNCKLSVCILELEEDMRQLQVGIENQSALQLVALQPATADYTTNISLIDMVIPVGEFRRLVSIVTQSGNYVICKLSCCTIEPEEDVRQLQVEMENQSVVKLVTPFHLEFCDEYLVEFHVNVKESTEPEVPLQASGSSPPCSDTSTQPEVALQAFGINSPCSAASTKPELSDQASRNNAPCSVASTEPEVSLQASGSNSPCSVASTEPQVSVQASPSRQRKRKSPFRLPGETPLDLSVPKKLS
ncbi:uncharacterized protein LOC128205684 [Mya arenaria]|uniref:uncharacterized protein LOC128205684 n=1 Tax=Mya arenaria TaxID=6604 RepID=UPI0022DF982C|nr:uncharacterized protein LOC128205684 [Mya arenaria]